MNQILYGHNSDERIVAVQQLSDSTMRLYYRGPSGITQADEPFYPFLFLSDRRFLEDFPKKHWLKELDGDLFFKFVCAFEEWPILWEAVRYMLDRYNRQSLEKVQHYSDLDFLQLYTDPVTQFLLQSGRTLFKEMAFDDIHRMQLDIETYTSPRFKFSKATRSSDRIILIALSDNKGWEHIIDGKKLDEKEMLVELIRLIRERDPDVIEGHHIYGFDIPYILKRCELHELSFSIGRDGSPPRSFGARTSFAEKSFEYTVAEIPGRHIIDTLLLVQSYDMGKRDMESYGLKYAARYFGVASPDRSYIKGSDISWYWDHDVDTLKKYALEDVTETRKLSDMLSRTTFYLTQMLPYNYGQAARLGSAAKIESLIIREYLRQRHSIPHPAEGTQTTGGYTDIFVEGVVGPIVHIDVESLYPSIMISKRIHPSSDKLQVFFVLLQELTLMRLALKREMKKTPDSHVRSTLDAQQSSLKILINSFYGYLGYGKGLFNDFSKADEVTKTGQQILLDMIRYIHAGGGKVIEVDTDGIFFIPSDAVRDPESEARYVEELSRNMPEGITVVHDGRYLKMFSYKKKNYALLGYDEKIKIRGSSLTSRSMERFGRTYIAQCIDFLLHDDFSGMHKLYAELHHSISTHSLDIKDFARVETLRDTIEEYQRQVAAGKRNQSAAYEVAIAAGRGFKPGDRIAYYVTGKDPNPKSFENCKPAELWDPNFPDENLYYYLRRLDEFSEKFRPFFLPQHFRAIFSADDLFPFDPAGIQVITSEAPIEERTSQDRVPGSFGIWLDE
jgi:DNA polymerase I